MSEIQAVHAAHLAVVLGLEVVLDRAGDGFLLGGGVAVLAVGVVPEGDAADGARESAATPAVGEVVNDVRQVADSAHDLVLDADAGCSYDQGFADADLPTLLEGGDVGGCGGIFCAGINRAFHGLADGELEVVLGPGVGGLLGRGGSEACRCKAECGNGAGDGVLHGVVCGGSKVGG